MNDRRFTFKFLGVLMESINNSPSEFRKNIWTAVAGISCIIAVWKLFSLLQVVVTLLLGSQ